MTAVIAAASCSLFNIDVLIGGSVKFTLNKIKPELSPDPIGGTLFEFETVAVKQAALPAEVEIEMVAMGAHGNKATS